MNGRRVLWVDGSGGAAGDMILGMLVDLGAPVARLKRELAGLKLDSWSLRSRRVETCGLAARKIDVRVSQAGPARRWKSIDKILRGAALDPIVRDNARAIFKRLFEAEAAVHGRSIETVHLHEAGADDALVDIVGACIGLHLLGVERVVVSRLTTGHGSVRCAHGTYPVPGPATLNLLEGVPAKAGELEVERLTPTGAAILTTLADDWGPMPPMRPLKTGYGAGDHDLGDTPNVLRGVLGAEEPDLADATADIVVLSTDLDDATPQALAYAVERLLTAGALDAYVGAQTMKKGRPGHRVTVLARAQDADRLGRLLLQETPALGYRFRTERRVELERSHCKVTTPYGPIRVKLGVLDGETINAWPEYEDCAAAARKHDVPLTEVQQAALTNWRGSGKQRKKS